MAIKINGKKVITDQEHLTIDGNANIEGYIDVTSRTWKGGIILEGDGVNDVKLCIRDNDTGSLNTLVRKHPSNEHMYVGSSNFPGGAWVLNGLTIPGQGDLNVGGHAQIDRDLTVGANGAFGNVTMEGDLEVGGSISGTLSMAQCPIVDTRLYFETVNPGTPTYLSTYCEDDNGAGWEEVTNTMTFTFAQGNGPSPMYNRVLFCQKRSCS